MVTDKRKESKVDNKEDRMDSVLEAIRLIITQMMEKVMNNVLVKSPFLYRYKSKNIMCDDVATDI